MKNFLIVLFALLSLGGLLATSGSVVVALTSGITATATWLIAGWLMIGGAWALHLILAAVYPSHKAASE